ncbi:ABC transporter ATP-binding protein [Demequina zhanjiangensis]|uniref:ABC transporter ATP-binding protein n=1 Tax=Demequina zhanjiangensis TaxID=3051659 RepID=A0ABT8G4J0_9MICO|nr:ABC transporter ATP-binding protein [Demequina sp. SYSU T00b26]MDN4474061.1 ABC transporter ATP-binding protein [Demequina sp. SYSU T00b26]
MKPGDLVLDVDGLHVDFYVEGEWVPAAIDLKYQVKAGEVLAIVGESGSGKTQSSMAMIGLLPRNGRHYGSAKLNGTELVGMSQRALSRVRGPQVGVIFQEPMTAMNPVYTVGFQIVETLRQHTDLGPHEAKERAIELLRLVEIPEPERRFESYPHQLSGGQRQRAMIAQALACDPALLFADEPTTALDVTVQAEILELIRDLKHRIHAGIVLITHDMGVVADMADRILVMKDGRVVEEGASGDIFTNPKHDYTKALLSAVPHLGASLDSKNEQRIPEDAPLVLEAKNLVIEYPRNGSTPAFRAVHGIDLTIRKGEMVALVGESGSGKTTVGRCAVGLLPVHDGSLVVNDTDMHGISRHDLAQLRKSFSIVFQDPGSSLNPRWPIGQSVGEPLVLAGWKKDRVTARVNELLDQVEIPRAYRNRYPHELSGGQRQRIGIARALALEPKLLIADEPTSALDVSVQARVLEIFADLQDKHGFGCLFVSHDLAVVEQLSDRIAVMRQGEIVEQGTTRQIISNPQHEYTQKLIAAVPVPDPFEQTRRRESAGL